MKTASCVLALLWIILSISSANAGSRPDDLAGDDRRSLKNNTPPPLTKEGHHENPSASVPRAAEPGRALPPTSFIPYSGARDPQSVKLEKMRNDYYRDVRKLDEQYRGIQEKFFKAAGTDEQKNFRKQLESIIHEKNDLTAKFRKEYDQTLKSQAPLIPVTPSHPNTPSPTAPLAGSPGGIPQQHKSMADFFDHRIRELGGPGLDKRTRELLTLGDNINDIEKALNQKYAEMIKNPSLTSKQKFQIEADIRQEKRMLAELYSSALHGRSPDPSKWAPQSGDPVWHDPPPAPKTTQSGGIPNLLDTRPYVGDWLGDRIEKYIVLPALAVIGLGGAP